MQFFPHQPLQFNDGLLGPTWGMGGSVTSVSLFASTITNTSSLAYPASIAAGDVAVILDFSRGVPVLPSGFTNIPGADSGGPNGQTRASYRILDGSETGSVSVMSDTDSGAVMLVFRGDVPITTVTPAGWTAEASATSSPATQLVPSGSGAAPLAVFGIIGAGTSSTTFGTVSPSFDAVLGSDEARLAYKIYNASPADVSVGGNDNGNGNGMASGYIAFS